MNPRVARRPGNELFVTILSHLAESSDCRRLSPQHPTSLNSYWCYTGPLDKADSVFAPIRSLFGPPALDWVGPIPHPALQGMFDPIYPPGHHQYWKDDFVNEISDEAIARHAEFGNTLPTPQATMHLYPIDSAGVSPDPAGNQQMIAWTRAYWAALHPYSAGGAFVNMMMDSADEGQDRVRASYGANYDRLAAIKAKYDPSNLFRVNQNIKPAWSPGVTPVFLTVQGDR